MSSSSPAKSSSARPLRNGDQSLYAIVFGLGFATVLTLIVTPAMLMAIENMREWRMGGSCGCAHGSAARRRPDAEERQGSTLRCAASAFDYSAPINAPKER